jgi:two-component system, OmpR family, sensor histidine kinase KdpD
LNLPDPEMLFLLAVMLTAVRFGRGPSLVAAALAVACFDFFFVPPLYGFDVADRQYILTFAMLFGVSLVLSELAGRLKRQEREAVSREERTAVLYALSRDLASAEEPTRIAQVAARHAAHIFSARAAILHIDGEGELRVIGASPADTTLDAKDLSVAKWALEHAELAGLGTDTLPGSDIVCAPLRIASAFGVLSLRPAHKAKLRTEQRAFLDVFCRQVAVALERVRLASEARSSALRAKTEEMRSSLLSSVSHDLRTPLASITGAATSLRDDPDLSVTTRNELIDSICEEAVRLERLLANLLDMTRLDSGAVSLKRDWVPLDEIVGSALTRLEDRLGDRSVTVRLPSDLPLLFVDPVLFEQLFVNLLENAAKYTPPGTPIEITAKRAGETVVIELIDYGPGLSPGSEEKVFDKFYRGPHVGVSGAGLGLPICRGIAEVHGGSIVAERRIGAGAVFRITVPIGGEPPADLHHQGAGA